jgi:copper chaperone CopZ
MKKYRLIIVLSFCMGVLLAISCSGNKQEKSKDQGEPSLIEVKIEGMTCTGCEQTIQRNVGKLEGIKSVKATFTDGRAVIEYFPGTVDTLKINDAITGSGYKVIKFSNIQSEEAAR